MEGEEKKLGRPTKFTNELADNICEIISTSSTSLRTLCKDESMPSANTIIRWLREKEDFRLQYARAKEDQADFLAEEIIEISDDATNDFMTIQKGDQSYEVENKEWTSRSKLRVDARKWIASKLKSKKWGDKIDLTSDGKTISNNSFQLPSNLTFDQLKELAKDNESDSKSGENTD